MKFFTIIALIALASEALTLSISSVQHLKGSGPPGTYTFDP